MRLNPKQTKNLRKHLRNNMTQTEVMLWDKLKNKGVLGYKFRRQYGVGPYVLDFYCPKLRLGVEVDGDSHFSRGGRIHDKERDSFIEEQGITLIRVTTTEVKQNLDGVIEYLADTMQKMDPYW